MSATDDPGVLADALDRRIQEIDDLTRLTEEKLVVLQNQKRDLLRARALLSHPADHVLKALDASYSGDPTAEFDEILGATQKLSDGQLLSGRFSKMGLYVEVARQMAMRGDGTVRVGDVANEVRRRNYSDSRISSLSATIHKALSRMDSWEHSGPGQFTYHMPGDEG